MNTRNRISLRWGRAIDIRDGDSIELRSAGRVWRWLERLLLLVGVICLGYYLYVYCEAWLYQSYEDQELDAILSTEAPSPSAAPGPPPRRAPPAPGTTIGRIEIPRLGVSAVIRAGSDARTLRLAVGYIPGTALPGETGNVGLAGHRDTFFRKLRDINPDDEIRVTTKEGVFHYFVQRTHIVDPEDVWVLETTSYPALTLVTCYPFSYIGSAPQRFIVRAALAAPKSVERPAPKSVERPAGTKPLVSSAPAPRIKRFPYNAEFNPQIATAALHDSRDLQPERRYRQDDNRRQRSDRSRASRTLRPSRRSRGGHGRLDLSRRGTR